MAMQPQSTRCTKAIGDTLSPCAASSIYAEVAVYRPFATNAGRNQEKRQCEPETEDARCPATKNGQPQRSARKHEKENPEKRTRKREPENSKRRPEKERREPLRNPYVTRGRSHIRGKASARRSAGTFSISRGQSRTCSSFAEARKPARKGTTSSGQHAAEPPADAEAPRNAAGTSTSCRSTSWRRWHP